MGKLTNNKLFLMTAHHKKDGFIPISKKYFNPIHVGKALSNEELGIIGDNEGENISNKNGSFCELTAYYYAWKNVDATYIGLMHYRRFFSEKSFFLKKFHRKLKYLRKRETKFEFYYKVHIKKTKKIEILSKSFYNYMNNNLNRYDIFVPNKICSKNINMEEQYILGHHKEDWIILKKIIKEKYSFLVRAMEISRKAKKFYIYNMFIMKKEIFNEYMEILFGILFTAEKLIDIKNKNLYQKRVFGFLAERIFNIYLNYKIENNKNIKVKEFNMVIIKD